MSEQATNRQAGGTRGRLTWRAWSRVSGAALALALVALPIMVAQAKTYYWDCNNGTAGFGTAGGTWAAPTAGTTTYGWSTNSAGNIVVNGNSVMTATSDALNFGTGVNGLLGGTITLSGTVSANSLTYGSASGTIILSGAGTLTLGGASPTITLNVAAATFGNNTASVIDGTAGLVMSGSLAANGSRNTFTLNPSAVSTFTGGLTLNYGTLVLVYTNLVTPTGLINSNNTLTVAGGNMTITGNTSGSTLQSFAGTTIGPCGGTISMNRNGGTSATLNLGNGITQSTGGVLFVLPPQASAWAAQTVPTNELVTFTGSVTHNGSSVSLPASGGGWGYVGAWLLGGAGAGSCEFLQAYNNAGTYTLSKGPAYTAWASSNSSPNVVYQDGGSAKSLSASESMYGARLTSTLSLNGNTLTINGIHGNASTSFTIQGGTLQVGPEKDLVIVPLNTGGSSCLISAAIVDNAGGASGVSVVAPPPIVNSSPVYLTGTNTFTGPLTVGNFNTVFIGDSGSLGSGNYAGNINLYSTLSFFASGTQSLSGSISGVIGNLNFGVGELRMVAPGGNIATTITPSGNAGGTLHFDNSASGGNKTWSLGTLDDVSGDYTLKLGGASGKTSTLTIAAISASTAVTKNFVIAGTGSIGTESAIVLTGQATGFINPRYYFGGSAYAWYDAGGYMRAVNYASDTKCKSVSGAFTTFAAAGAGATTNVDLDTSGTITAAGTESIATLRIGANGANPVTLAGGATLTISSGGILKAGGGTAATISGGTGITTGGANDLAIRCDTASDALTLGTPLLSSMTGKLLKSGAGTLTLSAAGNAHTGATYVNGGILNVTGTCTGNGAWTVRNGATLTGTGTIAGALTVDSGGTIQLGSSGAALTLSSTTAMSWGTPTSTSRLNSRTARLKIVPTGTALDKVSSGATAAVNLANTDLIVDTTGLKSAVSNAVILEVTGVGGYITNAFRSVTANNGSTGTVSYTSTQVKLSLTAPLTAPPKGTTLMVY